MVCTVKTDKDARILRNDVGRLLTKYEDVRVLLNGGQTVSFEEDDRLTVVQMGEDSPPWEARRLIMSRAKDKDGATVYIGE